MKSPIVTAAHFRISVGLTCGCTRIGHVFHIPRTGTHLVSTADCRAAMRGGSQWV